VTSEHHGLDPDDLCNTILTLISFAPFNITPRMSDVRDSLSSILHLLPSNYRNVSLRALADSLKVPSLRCPHPN